MEVQLKIQINAKVYVTDKNKINRDGKRINYIIGNVG